MSGITRVSLRVCLAHWLSTFNIFIKFTLKKLFNTYYVLNIMPAIRAKKKQMNWTLL